MTYPKRTEAEIAVLSVVGSKPKTLREAISQAERDGIANADDLAGAAYNLLHEGWLELDEEYRLKSTR
jgi:hypothetical protein